MSIEDVIKNLKKLAGMRGVDLYAKDIIDTAEAAIALLRTHPEAQPHEPYSESTGFRVNDDMFGAYAKIQTGASRDLHVYKVIGRIESNGYCDTPIMGGTKAVLHDEIVSVLNVVHCGVSEDKVIRVALDDCEILQQPNEPLTLEELREMEGWPVWTVTKGISDSGRWEIVIDAECEDRLEMTDREDGFYEIDTDSYGKTWLAYRRPPKEGQ